jgi:hypothetical protein
MFKEVSVIGPYFAVSVQKSLYMFKEVSVIGPYFAVLVQKSLLLRSSTTSLSLPSRCCSYLCSGDGGTPSKHLRRNHRWYE